MIARVELAVLVAAAVCLVVAYAATGFEPLLADGAAVGTASGDCEAVRADGLDQPANASSALALVAVAGGIGAAARQRRPFLGLAVALGAIGAGSFTLHGWSAAWAGDLEALGILWAAAWWAGWNLHRLGRWEQPLVWAAAMPVVLAGAVAVGEPVVDVALAAMVGLAVLSELAAWRLPRDRRRMLAAAGTFAIGVAVWLMSRSGRPWCDPDALLQGHAAWHVLAAAGAALSAWYLWSERA